MAEFVFETVTPAEASAYASAADNLGFSTPGASAAMAIVAYQGADVAISLGARTVVFGPGLLGEAGFAFPDGSRLFVGGTAGEGATGTSFGDGLFGGQGDDTLGGLTGDDLLQGNQGQDSLSAGAGADTVYGGQGGDVIDLGAGSNFGQGNLGRDTVSAAADAGRSTILGGQGDDHILGGGEGDFLNGNLGNDSLSGGDGDDMILGEGGVDTAVGGAGADTFVAGAGSSDAAALGSFTGEVVDRILDWTSADRIDKPGGALPPPGTPGVDPSYYYELSPASAVADADYYGPFGPPRPYDYWNARDECVRLMQSNPTLDVISVLADNDVLVFIDADGGNAPDLAIRLSGVNLDAVSYLNFI